LVALEVLARIVAVVRVVLKARLQVRVRHRARVMRHLVEITRVIKPIHRHFQPRFSRHEGVNPRPVTIRKPVAFRYKRKPTRHHHGRDHHHKNRDQKHRSAPIPFTGAHETKGQLHRLFTLDVSLGKTPASALDTPKHRANAALASYTESLAEITFGKTKE